MSGGCKSSCLERFTAGQASSSAALVRTQGLMIPFTSRLLSSSNRCFPAPDEEHLRLGRLAAAEDVPVALNASRFVVRHSAVVGSTGSGKTSAVASILQNFVKGGWKAANILVVDPHGEYSAAMSGRASVRSVLAQEEGKRLRVPYWALPALDILRIFAGGTGGATFSNRFAELVTKARRDFVESAAWLTNDPTTVTADTPIPFDIRPIWHQLDRENRETRTDRSRPCDCLRNGPGRRGGATVCTVRALRRRGHTTAQGSDVRRIRDEP